MKNKIKKNLQLFQLLHFLLGKNFVMIVHEQISRRPLGGRVTRGTDDFKMT